MIHIRVLTFFLFFILTCVCSAQPGTIDSSFAQNGKYYKPNGLVPTTTILQPDNKILNACYVVFAVSRLDQDGKEDAGFGRNGIADMETSLPSGYGFNLGVNNIALQQDGKILAGGFEVYNMYGATQAIIGRLNPNGTYDTNFNNRGVLRYYGEIGCYSLAVQDDGSILAATLQYIVENQQHNIVIHRLNMDGSPDFSFGGSSKVIIDHRNGDEDSPRLYLQGNGKILVAANSSVDSTFHGCFIKRLNTDGSADSTFAINSILEMNSDSNPYLVFQSDQKIMISTTHNNSPDNYSAKLSRFFENGRTDSLFGINGSIIYLFAESINPISRQYDDKLIGKSSGFTAIRINPDGSLDSTFGNKGFSHVIMNDTDYCEAVLSTVIQKGGKIVLAGTCYRHYSQDPYGGMTRLLSGLPCPAPAADFRYTLTDSTVCFTDHSSSAIGWHWNFGDGSTSDERNPVHRYPSYGKYLACLNINDSCGNASYCDSIIFCHPPDTHFTFSSGDFFVAFNDSSYQANSWHWEFGDGAESFEQNPVHEYRLAGKYNVCLSSANACLPGRFCDSVTVLSDNIPTTNFSGITVYPNPVSSILYIAFGNITNGGVMDIEITDMSANRILQCRFRLPTGETCKPLDLHDLRPGMYFIRVNSDRQVITRKFLRISDQTR
jgi:uncharacterized delta-60 repeat protein